MADVTKHSDTAALWGILWRSLIFLPYMLLTFIVVCGIWLARWVLPVWAALHIYDREWWSAIGTILLWIFVVGIYRRFRLARFFEAPPSLL